MAERGQLFAQEEASEQDDFSDLATRRALRDLYEAKEVRGTLRGRLVLRHHRSGLTLSPRTRWA